MTPRHGRGRPEVVVVGGGAAGIAAALAAAHEGARTALVEAEQRLGGDCTFHGCVPSKALIEVAGAVRRTAVLVEAGILDGRPSVAFAAVAAHQRALVEAIADDERDERFHAAGVEVVHGRATLVDRSTLSVGGRLLHAARIVIATGGRPAVPPLPGLGDVPFLTNETVFALDRLPARLLVLGAGAIGLELAQAFARLGSRVTVVEATPSILPGHEPPAGEVVAHALAEDGVELLLGSTAVGVRPLGSAIELALESGVVTGDALLVATGRRAAGDGLGLERLGVRLDRGAVPIDRRARTSVPGIYAAGDVTGGMQATHVAAHQGAVAGRNAAGGRARIDERVVPSTVFTDPEVARVGLTEAEALATRRGVVAATFPFARVDRARLAGRPAGFVKLVTAARPVLGRAGGGVVVGGEIAGPGAGELIHEVALAMRTGMFAGRLAQTIHAYPTLSMGVQVAAGQLFPIGRLLAPGGAISPGGGS